LQHVNAQGGKAETQSFKVRVPAGTENGQRLRVRGRGLPKGKKGERGNLYVAISIHVPVHRPKRTGLWG